MARDRDDDFYINLKKRDEPEDSCFGETKRILQMGVAADCTYTQNFGGPADTLRRIISNWNQVSEACKSIKSYSLDESTFNIQLAIFEVKILQGCGDGRDGESLQWNKVSFKF